MSQETILQKAILRVLRPLVRILLRNNIAFGAFSELARQAYVEVATDDFTVDGRKQSNSRIATITGLSRKEVKRIQEMDAEARQGLTEKYNRAARVVFGWVHDKRYQEKGEAIVLPFEGSENSFSALVKTYSGDVPPRAILDELKRVGVVEIDEQNRIHLMSRAYIPKAGINEKIEYLGTDVSALLNTMDRNIYETEKSPYFQRKVFYDNIPDNAVEEIRLEIAASSQQLLEKIDKVMASHDRDVNPDVKGEGRNALGIGVYYFEESNSQEEDNEQ